MWYYHTGNPGGDDRDDVLLVAVLVPILSVLLLVALLVSVTVGGWRLWAKRCAFIQSHHFISRCSLSHTHSH